MSAVTTDEPRDVMIKQIFLEYRGALLHDVLSQTKGDWQWAEDIVQETMVRAWQHADSLDPAKGSVRGWLGTVARNVLIDTARSNRSRPATTDDGVVVPTGGSGDPADGVATALLVKAAIRRLRPCYRDVLVQLYFLDRTAAQAAEALGIPIGTVKSRAFHGLTALRRILPQARFKS